MRRLFLALIQSGQPDGIHVPPHSRSKFPVFMKSQTHRLAALPLALLSGLAVIFPCQAVEIGLPGHSLVLDGQKPSRMFELTDIMTLWEGKAPQSSALVKIPFPSHP